MVTFTPIPIGSSGWGDDVNNYLSYLFNNSTLLTSTQTLSNKTFSDNVLFTSTGAIKIPVGTTAQRPTPALVGYLRLNSSTGLLEKFDGTNWVPEYFDPLTTQGDIPFRNNGVTSRLPFQQNSILLSNLSSPLWLSIPSEPSLLTSANNGLSFLPNGPNGFVLSIDNGNLVWAAGGGGTFPIANGSLSNPSMAFTGANVGWYRPANNAISAAVLGTKALTITNSMVSIPSTSALSLNDDQGSTVTLSATGNELRVYSGTKLTTISNTGITYDGKNLTNQLAINHYMSIF